MKGSGYWRSASSSFLYWHIPTLSVFLCRALQDYHAIKLAYGNKKARKYLYELQKSLSHDASVYSPELLKKITTDLNIKSSSLESIKQDDYIIRASIEEDQKLANQWNIKANTTINQTLTKNFSIIIH